MIADASPGQVSLAWLFGSLKQRSFGIVMLVLGFTAMVPGIGIVAAAALAILSFQMMMGRTVPVLPRFIALRPLPTDRVVRLMGRTVPPIAALEAFVRPRWPFMAAPRAVGAVLLLLTATLFLPVPLSNILPGMVTMFLALAYLEEDGVLLTIAFCAVLASLMATGLEAWAAIRGADFLFRLRAGTI